MDSALPSIYVIFILLGFTMVEQCYCAVNNVNKSGGGLSADLASGREGDVIRGYPCIKRLNQMYCPRPGNNYPQHCCNNTSESHKIVARSITDVPPVIQKQMRSKIDTFIDENKSLLRRMYGEFPTGSSNEDSPPLASDGFSGFHDQSYSRARRKRSQSTPSSDFGQTNSDRVDSCESAIEVVTPYWASNSAAKIRAIVNTQHFEQAIQQEVCQKEETNRCKDDCSCEQKYKWHRLLAYDPDDECKGIFMDWFLFPSCCVCRCNKNPLKK